MYLAAVATFLDDMIELGSATKVCGAAVIDHLAP